MTTITTQEGRLSNSDAAEKKCINFQLRDFENRIISNELVKLEESCHNEGKVEVERIWSTIYNLYAQIYTNNFKTECTRRVE